MGVRRVSGQDLGLNRKPSRLLNTCLSQNGYFGVLGSPFGDSSNLNSQVR
jgi:hypothetical protein